MKIGDLVKLEDGSVGLIVEVGCGSVQHRRAPIQLVQWLDDGMIEDVGVYDPVEVINENR